jgi:3-methylcrotonyl-CoA carboxylase alpha subunit/acetyl-CoA/propionyl-CoA carboxylase biotin carboxyl carrier protein
MLGKVIVHGTDRESARRALVAALDDTAILGLTTNLGFLRELAAADAFRDCAIDTAWLDEVELHRPEDEVARILAAWAEAMAPHGADDGPFAADGWRIGGSPAPIRVDLDGDPQVQPTGPGTGRLFGYDVRELSRQVDGAVTRLSVELGGADLSHVGGPRHVGHVRPGRHAVEVAHRGQRWVYERPDVFADHGPLAGEGTITAPMPGTVLSVDVEPGQEVVAGDVLGLLEAMKMEIGLTAPFAGTVTEVGAAAGDQVALGVTLFVVEEKS